ncbi:MAG: hypothetical protein E6936_13645 [Clostridium perfringens]|nr:hypothetical protein [Clostridium perfringens]
MNYKYIKDLKNRYSKEKFEGILLVVEQDLKFNKLRFNKRITNKEFLTVIISTEGVFRRL